MVITEREMSTTFTEMIKRDIEVWGHNLNGWMKNLLFIFKEHNLDY